MTGKERKIKVIVVYNSLVSSDTASPDYISESEVKDTAEYVLSTALKIGFDARILPFGDIVKDIQHVLDFSPDLVFNLCEGFRGNSGFEMNMAGLWELLDIPYTGNIARTLCLAQDKAMAKSVFASNGILTPDFEILSEIPLKTSLLFPLIAKPTCEDASLGIGADSVLYDLESLKRKVAELMFRYKQPILVEQFIQGREFNISVLGNNPPQILPISEIDFSHLGKEFQHITSYEAKWIQDHPLYAKTPSICPANISGRIKEKLETIGLKVFQALKGKDYGRVDVRMDSNENIYVLEYNPNPAIANDAGFHKALIAAGLSFEKFVRILIEENLNQAKDENKKNVA